MDYDDDAGTSTTTISPNSTFKKPEILTTTGAPSPPNPIKTNMTTDQSPKEADVDIIDLSDYDSPPAAHQKTHLTDEVITEQLSSGSEISTCSEPPDDLEMPELSPKADQLHEIVKEQRDAARTPDKSSPMCDEKPHQHDEISTSSPSLQEVPSVSPSLETKYFSENIDEKMGEMSLEKVQVEITPEELSVDETVEKAPEDPPFSLQTPNGLFVEDALGRAPESSLFSEESRPQTPQNEVSNEETLQRAFEEPDEEPQVPQNYAYQEPHEAQDDSHLCSEYELQETPEPQTEESKPRLTEVHAREEESAHPEVIEPQREENEPHLAELVELQAEESQPQQMLESQTVESVPRLTEPVETRSEKSEHSEVVEPRSEENGPHWEELVEPQTVGSESRLTEAVQWPSEKNEFLGNLEQQIVESDSRLAAPVESRDEESEHQEMIEPQIEDSEHHEVIESRKEERACEEANQTVVGSKDEEENVIKPTRNSCDSEEAKEEKPILVPSKNIVEVHEAETPQNLPPNENPIKIEPSSPPISCKEEPNLSPLQEEPKLTLQEELKSSPPQEEPETAQIAPNVQSEMLNGSGLSTTNGSFLTADDSNLSTDSEGNLVIDQEATYPKSQAPQDLIQTPALNGFDFNNYLKRKISSAIEEGLNGPPMKRRRNVKPRAKKNNGANVKVPPQPKPKPETLLEEYLKNTKTAADFLPKPKVDIGEIFDAGHEKMLLPMPAPYVANFSNSSCSSTASSTTSAAVTPSSSAKDSRNDPNPRRKVFLCSSCNQHYENWNLFLHMRDVHRRFTCLYCMGIFHNSDKLLAHLENKHNLSKKYYNDKHDILNSYKNMYNSHLYLMCIECEHVFDESEEFTHHSCERYLDPCNVCGLRKKCNHKEDKKSHSTKKNNQQQSEPAKTTPTQQAPLSEIPPLMPTEESPPRHSGATTSQTATPSSGGGSLKLKFKFNRLSNSKNSPCKITVEAPQLLDETANDRVPVAPILQRLDAAPPVHSSFVPSLQEMPPQSYPMPTGLDSSLLVPQVSPQLHFVQPPPPPVPVQLQEQVPCSFEAPVVANLPLVAIDSGFADTNAPVGSFTAPEFTPTLQEHISPQQPTLPQTHEHQIQKPFTHWGQSLDASMEDEQAAMPETPSPQPPLVPKLRLTLPKNFKPIRSDESSTESDEEPEVPEPEVPVPEEVAEPDPSPEPQEPLPEPDPVEDVPMEIERIKTPEPPEPDDGIEVADEYTQLHDLRLDQPLDKIDLVFLLRTCLEKTIPFCLYCYHARRIAVNGKGLALHMIGCHRFQATVDSITAEELKPATFVAKFKSSLDELQTIYLNQSRYCSAGNEISVVEYPKECFYECMQCRYTTGTHKELYVHNRKLHLRSKLICIMCKIPFYSFCDLICHMCPGVSNQHSILDFEFRCCLCNMDHIPSAFRLMIHLRRRHFACDVCVEVCHDTLRLSSHVWKHKLHHLCYRCGIAYRNKADIQKHLFWRHGTESVQCKKCLQKKWPHVYHFCMPPAVFYCEICSLQFTRAVSLRVHKRIHTEDAPYPCTEEGCEKKFVSKKLLLKHVERHNEPAPLPPPPVEEVKPEEKPSVSTEVEKEKKKLKKKRKKDDILDLINFSGPNLSESDSSDESDTEKPAPMSVEPEEKEVEPVVEPENVPATDIWENFKHFQESQGKSFEEPSTENVEGTENSKPVIEPEPEAAPESMEAEASGEISDETVYKKFKPKLFTCQGDHDYCVMYEPKMNAFVDDFESELQATVITDYAKLLREEREKQENHAAAQRAKFFKSGSESPRKKPRPRKRRASSSSSSSSSSDSDSSCSCGSSCSCSSSSSSSDSESDNARPKKAKTPPPPPPEPVDPDSIVMESDLETDESETDEEFYDEHPQKLANQQLAEKRRQLMLQHSIDPQNAHGIIENSRSSTPSLPEEVIKSEKKNKTKKRKRDKKEKVPSLKLVIPKPTYPVVSESKIEDLFQNAIQQAYDGLAEKRHHQQEVVEAPVVEVAPVIPVYVPPPPPPVFTPAPQETYQPPLNPILASMPSYQHPIPPPPMSPFSADGSRSKRQRKPNKFYGYDDEEQAEAAKLNDPYQPPPLTWDKDDLPSTTKMPRPPAKRLSTSSKSKSRTGSRVNSLEDPVSQPIFKAAIAAPPPIEPLRISLSSLQQPSDAPGKLLDSDEDEPMQIVCEPPKPKIPKLKLSGLKKPQPRKVPTPRAPKPKKPKPVPLSTGPRVLGTTSNIQLEQYPSSVTQSLFPAAPVEASQFVAPSQPASYYRNDVKYPIQPPANWRPAKEGEKVYCYCRSPYDEVSEMIGCDDAKCKIEWFHFECVGILMPPSGKWYCPDCKPQHMHEFATDYDSGSY